MIYNIFYKNTNMEEKSFYINAQTFCWLVEENSFSKVGKIHELNQSTISRRILALEEELGVILIRRNTRNLEITDDGYEFYNFFSDYHKQLYYDVDNFKNSQNRKNKETIRIAIPMGVSNQILLPQLPKFLRENEHLNVQIFYQNREIDLIKEHYDLAIVRKVPENNKLKITEIYKHKIQLYCTPEYVENFGLPLDINDLVKNHDVIGGLEDAFHENVNKRYYINNEVHEFEKDCRIKINNNEPAYRLAKSGYFITIGLDPLFKNELENGKLIKVLPEYYFEEFKLYLATVNDYRNTKVTEFSKFIIECFKNKEFA